MFECVVPLLGYVLLPGVVPQTDLSSTTIEVGTMFFPTTDSLFHENTFTVGSS